MPAAKPQRLSEFYRRLEEAAPVDSRAAALDLLSTTLNVVEDELSGVPYDPDNWQNDQRLYPPRPDSARDVESRPDLTRYRSRGHNTFIRTNGAIEIRTIDGIVQFTKLGLDGRGVEL